MRVPEKSRGKGLEPDDTSQKKSIEHWCLLFTLSYSIPRVTWCLQYHLGSKPSNMMYSLKGERFNICTGKAQSSDGRVSHESQ